MTTPLPPNTEFGRYRIQSKLGAGGMGEVYLAEDTKLHRKVAIKLLPLDSDDSEEANRRLLREARAAAKLEHANICTIHEVGEEGGRSFICMQYVEGETLEVRMRRTAIEVPELLSIACQAADALAEAHSRGIVHRDIKPSNLMITPRGVVKIMDFGLAKAFQSDVAHSEAETEVVISIPGAIIGTLPYMSPEQVRAETLDGRSDIFSFGVVLYELLSGHHPFADSSSAATASAILTREPLPLARYANQLPAELERIISKTLRKDKDDRYQTAKDLLIDFRNLKRRLEIEDEIHRTAPDVGIKERQPTNGRISPSAIETTSQHGEATQSRGHHPAASSTNQILGKQRSSLLFAVSTAAVVMLVIVGIFLFKTRSQKTIDSLAVLPFTNLSADPETEYLADGISETLINSLAQLPNLRVVPRSTVFRYKGSEDEPQAIGRSLNVRAVLVGRVLQRGDTLSIQTELIDIGTDSQLWGEQYNRKLMDILTIQESIATEISNKLRLQLSGKEKEQLTKRYTDNTEAYQLYLKGRYQAAKYTPEGFNKGIEYFRQAIALDSNYALAYDGLSYCYYGNWYIPAKEAGSKGKEAAHRALELDPTLAEAHASLATINAWYDYNWAGAEKEFRRALELNPKYGYAHGYYALFLVAMRRFEEGTAEGKRAVELEPLSPELNTGLGIVHFYQRQYDEAFEQLNRTIEFEPSFWWARVYLARVHERKGNLPAAIAELQKARSIEGATPEVLAALGRVYAVSGNKGEAQKIIMELKEQSQRSYVPGYDLAIIFAALGEKDQAFEELENEYRNGGWYMNFLKIDPDLDNLRSDPRFSELVERMRLP
jgi:serine/threonine-protein kinase